MRSLRFRIPAIFLVGVFVAGSVTALLAVRLFQDYTHDRAVDEIQRQAAGLARLYEDSLHSLEDEGREPDFTARLLEDATGSRLYYAGIEIVPAGKTGLRSLDRSFLRWDIVEGDRMQTFELVPPDADRTFLAAAHPIEAGGATVGALIVAKPRAELQSRWFVLAGRMGLAFAAGLVVALGLIWYLSRRLTKPVLGPSRAADEVAAGRYDLDLPRKRRGDEIGHLTDRFREMTERLAESQRRERTFLMVISHELRTPVTAIRGHVDALREGLAGDAEARDASLAVIRAETERLARLVGDVLDLARLEAHSFQLEEHEVDLRRLLEQVFQTFTEEARRRGIDYECSLDTDAVLSTDGDRLLQ